MIDARPVQTALGKYGYRIAVDGDFGPGSYSALFAFVGRGVVSPATNALGHAAVQYFPAAGLTTSLRIAHALARWAVETRGFKVFEEALNYSPERLCVVWPKRFPNLAAAAPFAHNPQALANKTYGNRMGNCHPGDGYRYRGRSLSMLTGLDEYAEAAHLTGLDLVGNPDLLGDIGTGLQVACAYWTARGINAHADRDDVEGVCLAINGGEQGLADQRQYLARARLVLK